jgi:hypothetical protein
MGTGSEVQLAYLVDYVRKSQKLLYHVEQGQVNVRLH